MTTRTVVVALVVFLLLAGVGVLSLLRGGAAQEEPEDPPGVRTIVLDEPAPDTEPPRKTLAEVRAQRLAEQTIEEEIASSTPAEREAAYLMSRIREARDEGNPAFAAALLAHLTAEHPTSSLIQPAQDLLTEGE